MLNILLRIGLLLWLASLGSPDITIRSLNFFYVALVKKTLHRYHRDITKVSWMFWTVQIKPLISNPI